MKRTAFPILGLFLIIVFSIGQLEARTATNGEGIFISTSAAPGNFGLAENVRLQFRVDVFNVFNRANFANPSGTLSVNAMTGAISSGGNFGRATQTLNRSLGGLGSIYQIGGPRSLQFAAKVQF